MSILLRIQCMFTQRQTNKTDCGVFAIAVAAELVCGRDPVDCVWDIPAMRPHLKDGFESGAINSFPTIRRENRVRRFKGEPVKTTIYCCLCRMPETRCESYICCDVCSKWYHHKCVGVCETEDVSKLVWKCPPCTVLLQ